MSMQIVLQKSLSKIDFLTSTQYERYDLTNQIKKGDRFMVRHGDLIIINYEVNNYRRRGLRRAYLEDRKGILNFANSHYIIPEGGKTVLVHNEHGLIIIPEKFERLNFYTINYAVD
jgi:hypothetical protein